MSGTGRRVLLFARDPGGANTVLALVGQLKSLGYQVSLFGKDFALGRYRLWNQPNQDIALGEKPTLSQVQEFLRHQAPDVIITGTSSDDFTERYMWQAARTMGIPVLCILDQWMNYGIRFSPYTLSEMALYADQPVHAFLPDRILVMDDLARGEMVKEGLPEDSIVVTGQPYFQLIQTQALQPEKVLEIKANLFEQGETFKWVTFISEPISQTGNLDLGYTEHTVLATVLPVLNAVAAQVGELIGLLIKLHPKENPDNFQGLQAAHYPNLRIVTEQQMPSWEIIAVSDLICGMSSMLLLEAQVLGKPILSVQPGLKKQDPFILSRIGYSRTIENPEELSTEFSKALFGCTLKDARFSFLPDAIQNVVNIMEILLCNS